MKEAIYIIRPVPVTGGILDTEHDGLARGNVDLPVDVSLVGVVLRTVKPKKIR